MLLHEQLREWARQGNGFFTAIDRAMCDLNFDSDIDGKDERKLLNYFADTIEQEYIPRLECPKYEESVYDADGIEIKSGDQGWQNYGEHRPVTVKEVHPPHTCPGEERDKFAWIVYEEGGWDCAESFTHNKPVFDTFNRRVRVKDIIRSINNGYRYKVIGIEKDGLLVLEGINTIPIGLRVIGPADCCVLEIEVRDAEGIILFPGETVWNKHTNTKLIVEEVRSNEQVYCKDQYGYKALYSPRELVHHNPDSLEKLRDDISRNNIDPVTSEINRWVDRLTALIECDA